MTMTAKAREAYNAYMREWHKRNPTKNAEYKASHWERKAAQLTNEPKGGNQDETKQET